MTVVIVTGAGIIFHHKNKRLSRAEGRVGGVGAPAVRPADRFPRRLQGGRLNTARSDDLFDDALEVSKTAANIKIRTQAETFKMIVTSQISMYILLGAVVFVAPNLSDTLGGSSIAKTTTALLFIVGACFGLVQSIPILLNANAAADRIERLEEALRDHCHPPPSRAIAVAPKRFDRIEMHNIMFRYVDKFSDTAFKIGPIDFSHAFRRARFSSPAATVGKIDVPAGAGRALSAGFRRSHCSTAGPSTTPTRDEYRALMSAIFFDYHLFQRLYGMPDADPGRHRTPAGASSAWPTRPGLSNGEFRTLDLSGGQRRRLALIVSMLEKRPIMILDEWTAEQDPEFRRKFYDELLPEMLQAGATVVVITHDDRYLDELHLPARRIRMDEGRIVEERTMG